MSTMILDGRAVRDARIPALKEAFSKLIKPPTLSIIQVGDRSDSSSYIKAKSALAAKLGVPVRHIKLPDSIAQQELIARVWEQNEDEEVRGIIVQLPLPLGIDREDVIKEISPKKDVDALTPDSIAKWVEGREDAILPATARGVKALLDHYGIGMFKKHVVVIGRSNLVGKPIAIAAANQGADVTVCHSKTEDLIAETKRADILVVAVGKPGLITAEHVSPGAVVVDVGINTVKGEKLEEEVAGKKVVGDVDFAAVSKVVSAISPVPGGVGPMTVLSIFENLLDLVHYQP